MSYHIAYHITSYHVSCCCYLLNEYLIALLIPSLARHCVFHLLPPSLSSNCSCTTCLAHSSHWLPTPSGRSGHIMCLLLAISLASCSMLWAHLILNLCMPSMSLVLVACKSIQKPAFFLSLCIFNFPLLLILCFSVSFQLLFTLCLFLVSSPPFYSTAFYSVLPIAFFYSSHTMANRLPIGLPLQVAIANQGALGMLWIVFISLLWRINAQNLHFSNSLFTHHFLSFQSFWFQICYSHSRSSSPSPPQARQSPTPSTIYILLSCMLLLPKPPIDHLQSPCKLLLLISIQILHLGYQCF